MANTTVQSEQIQDGSITADKLADGTIVAAELADNAVVTAAINADAVTGAKIADNAINSEHYTDGSIDTAHIADAQITVGKMAANSVDSDQYVDGSIDTVHIADLQVTTAKIANGNISTAKIADNAVTSAKIDTNIDIAGTFDVTGATTLDSTLAVAGVTTITTADNNPQLTLTSTDADANVGPVLKLYRNSGSPADDDLLGRIQWSAEDDAGNDSTFARINVVATDVSNNSEDARMEFAPAVADDFTPTMSLSGGNVGIGTTTPSTGFNVNRNNLVISDASAAGLTLNSTATDGSSIISMTDGTGTLAGEIHYVHDNDSMRFNTANTERMRIDSSGNVGIRNTSPVSLNSLGGSQFVIGDGTGTQNLYIYSATNGSGHIAFADSNANGSSAQYAGLIQYNHTENRMRFYTGATEKWRIESNGHLKAAANGYGINFDASKGSNESSTVLDDYEEGSWSPALNGATTSINDAHYVKIGAFVYLNCYFTFSGLPNDGQVFKITGLPYATQPNATYGGGVISYTHAANTADMQPLTQSGDSYIYFHETDGTSATVTRATAYGRFPNGAGYILLNMFYITAF